MLSLPASRVGVCAARSSAQQGAWQLGSLKISRGAQPPCAAPGQGALLLIPHGHGLCLRQEHLPRIPQPPADLVYLPAGEVELRVAAFEGWRVELDVEQLCLLAAELADHRLSPARFRRHLKQARPLELRSSPLRDLGAALQQLLELSAAPALRQQGQLELLELDRMIQRLVALVLCRDLIHAARQHSDHDPGHRNRVFDDLLEWIQAHLHQPIQLQDLEQQSGYSQRSLRNFFRERFDCGPVQWIRSQRLQLARERLLSPQPRDTVGTIAAALGYDHPSQFSRDFQQTFGCRPSALLREGRRCRELE